MYIGAGILLVGILAGVLIANTGTSSAYPWHGGMMYDDDERRGAEDGYYAGGPGMMMDGDERGMGMMHGNMFARNEQEFIEHMVPHHEEAIETAKEVLERGGTTQAMVDLANGIITSQTAEVAFMKASYEEWFGKPYADTGIYEPMMRELEAFSGVTLDRVFLHDMTMHHMGAIMMARSVQPYLEHDSMKELTNNIIVNQSKEIETMQQIFSDLKDDSEE